MSPGDVLLHNVQCHILTFLLFRACPACLPACPACPACLPAVVGLAAEMFICRRMAEQTGGTYTGKQRGKSGVGREQAWGSAEPVRR